MTKAVYICTWLASKSKFQHERTYQRDPGDAQAIADGIHWMNSLDSPCDEARSLLIAIARTTITQIQFSVMIPADVEPPEKA